MRQKNFGVYIEFFESQDTKKIEALIRGHLPPMRTVFVLIDHKNFLHEKKREVKTEEIGKEVALKYKCPVDGKEWEGNAFAVEDGFYVWSRSDVCPKCGAKGEIQE